MDAEGLWAHHCVLSKISFVAFADFHGVTISTVAVIQATNMVSLTVQLERATHTDQHKLVQASSPLPKPFKMSFCPCYSMCPRLPLKTYN